MREPAVAVLNYVTRRCWVLLCSSAGLATAGCQRIVTGDAAAATFVYQGRPVHPACVWFSRERASRGRPITLASCSASSSRAVMRDGWTFAEKLPPPAEGASSGNGYSGYRVLARNGARYLLALESSGGGTGKFSDLSWVQLGQADVKDVEDILGGDRCGGGLGRYHVFAESIGVSATISTVDLLRLARVGIPESTRDSLRSGYLACDGYANYEYDLVADSLRLRSVSFLAPGAEGPARLPTTDPRDPQACFDGVVRRMGLLRRPMVPLPELEPLGARFTQRCLR